MSQKVQQAYLDVDREISNEFKITVPGPDPIRHWICVNSKRSVPCRDHKRK